MNRSIHAPFFTGTARARLRLARWLTLAAGLFVAALAPSCGNGGGTGGGGSTTATTTGTGGSGGDCGECFRAVNCVKECGGEVLQSGCCPCPPGTFDDISCPLDGGADSGDAASD